MRYLFSLVLCLSILSSIAQPGNKSYSISDKKSIKLYEEAADFYQVYALEAAEDNLNKSIDRSPNFIEAYILLSQVYSETNQMDKAIQALEKSVEINPNFFPNSYYFLGEMYMMEANYNRAAERFQSFIESGKGSKKNNDRAELGIRSCRFSKVAVANPVNFEPINCGPNVNTDRPEYYPCLTGDEQTLLFTRDLKNAQAMNGRHEDFFVAEKEGDSWGNIRNISEINTLMNEGAPTLSPDGQVLIFTACEIDGDWGKGRAGLGSCDLFFSQKVGSSWSSPLNLGERINSYSWESQPSYAADGKTLYFVRGKFTGRGIAEQDIWVSKLSDGGVWQKPERIHGEINTPYEEESVMIHPDGQTLYFSSNGHPGLGGLDIFMSKLLPDGTWGEPVNLGYPINTEKNENSLLVSTSGEVAFFASDREGGYGDLDLYYFEMPEEIRPDKVTYAKGVVYDELSFKKLEAKFELIDLETERTVVQSFSNRKSGEFLVSLPTNKDYALNVSRPGYLFYSENFSLKGYKSMDPYVLDIPLQKIKPGSKAVLNNVFFDTDKYDLKPQSMVELNKLVEFLTINPHVKIEIGGHTDNVGGDGPNQILSERRALAVADYLTVNGIEKWRIAAKGYGESTPIASNETESGRAKNRRTEFMIIE